jgi:hypothetical protein
MTWGQFFNRPKNVFVLVATLVGIWLLFNPAVLMDFINNTVMPILMNLLVLAIMVYGIRYMFTGGKSGSSGSKKK